MNLLGNLIIAPPAVKTTFWHKTTIIITEHHHQGSVGLVLNKRSELTIHAFGQQLGFEINQPGHLYIGGPVNPQSLSFLHTNEWVSKNTMRINDRFSVSSAEDILPRMAMGDLPIKWRLFLGMAGWSAGQLVGEIKGIPPWNHNTSWCLCSADLDLVFDSDDSDQWCHCLDRSASEFAQNILA
jgi:putative transcriptional regulator